MNFKRNILILLFCVSRLFSQTATSELDPQNYDFQLAEKTFARYINALRDARSMYFLEPEDALQLASRDQSAYVKKTGLVSHEQKEKTKSTPEKRSLYFGGKCKNVGEVCLKTNLKKKKDKKSVRKTYNELISFIVSSSLRSKEDSAVLLNPALDSYGFSLEFSGDSVVYAVIVMGKNPNITLKQNLAGGEFGVLPYDKKNCNCIESKKTFNNDYDVTLMVYGDSLFLKSEHLPFLKKFFTDPKDGFYVDIVYRYQFPCGRENKLDTSEIFDGEMLKPARWIDLLRNNRAHDGKNLFTFYSKLPPGSSNYLINFNTAVVKNGRQCIYQILFSPPGYNFPLLTLYPKWIYDEKLKLKADTFGGKVKIPFPFEVNETRLQNTHKSRIERKLKAYLPYITSATIRTYSSIEGDEISNLKLQEARAEVIHQFLKKMTKRDIPVKIESKENWEYFLEHIKNSPFEYLADMSREEIRSRVNKKSLRDSLKYLLYKSRESTMEFELDARVDDKSDPDLIFAGYQRSVELGDSGRANAYQNKLLQHFFQHNYPGAEIINCKLPYNKKFLKTWTNYLALQLNNEDLIKNYSVKDSALKAISIDEDFMPLHFNFCLLALKYLSFYDTIIPIPELEDKMNKSYSFARDKKDSVLVNHMFLNYHLISLYLYWNTYQYDKIDKPLGEIKRYYPLADISETEAIELGHLFNYHTRWDWTLELMLPYMRKNTENENSVFLYVMTTGSNPIIPRDEWIVYLKKAKKMNPVRFKTWLDKSQFQLLRDEDIKKVFCEG